jgi:hypothetical protein
MKKTIFAMVVIACATAGTVQADSNDARIAEAKGIVKEFFTTLKGQLQASMKAGGPVQAIDTCNITAPAIASAVSSSKGWDVARTSMKYRNPDNAPDAWEQKVLAQFEEKKARGADPAKLAHAEVVEQDGKQVFRFMKAIPTAKLCLNCHGGAEIKPEVASKLIQHYPQDKARGYKEGDIRGAFTLQKML